MNQHFHDGNDIRQFSVQRRLMTDLNPNPCTHPTAISWTSDARFDVSVGKSDVQHVRIKLAVV